MQNGVVVQFNYSCSLIVYGVLSATGATFTSSQITPSKGDWDGIYIGLQYGDTSSGNATLANCQVSYGNAVYLEKGNLWMNSGDFGSEYEQLWFVYQ